jgi:hypothetical protein
MSFQCFTDFNFPTDAEMEKRGRELEIYLANVGNLLNGQTVIIAHPKMQRPIARFLVDNDHKVNGSDNGWHNGGFRSRWCDCTIEGEDIRLAFYSRKNDAKFFASLPPTVTGKVKYALYVTK